MKQKRAGKQLNRGMIEVLIPALLSICVGILIIGYEVYNSFEYLVAMEFTVLDVLGITFIILGISGIRLEKSKQFYFLKNVASKHEKVLILFLSYSLWMLAVVWAVLAVFIGNGNFMLAVFLSAISILTLFCSFFMCMDCGLNILNKCISGYKIGWEYFNTGNPREEYEKMLRYRNPAEYEEIERLKKVQWILFGADLLIGLVLYFVHQINVSKFGYWYYLVSAMLPLTLYIFAWIHKDVAGWREDTNADIKWKDTHFTVFWPVQIIILINLRFVYIPMLIQMQCISGAGNMIMAGLILFIVLIIISITCIGWKKQNIVDYFWNGIFTFTISWGLIFAIFFTLCGTPSYRVAEVERMDKSVTNKGFMYFVTIVLEDENIERIMVSKRMYESLNQGQEVLLVDRKGILGTEFLSLQMLE